MEKRLKKLIKKVNAVHSKAHALLRGKTANVSAGIKRATRFLELARDEIEGFRRQYLSKAKAKPRPKKKIKGK